MFIFWQIYPILYLDHNHYSPQIFLFISNRISHHNCLILLGLLSHHNLMIFQQLQSFYLSTSKLFQIITLKHFFNSHLDF